MPARASYDYKVWDTHSACEILHIKRRGYFDKKAFTSAPSITSLSRYLADDGGGAAFLGYKGDNDVIACSWSKDTMSPCGVFTFQLKHRRGRYLKAMSPGDLVIIFMDDAKDFSTGTLFTGKLITIGIVDRVSEITSVRRDGAEVVTTAVTGRDFGVIPLETSTVFDPSFAQIEQTLITSVFQERLYGKQAAAQSPAEMVMTILDLYYNVQATGSTTVATQWQFQNKYTKSVPLTSLLDVTTFVQRPMFGYSIVDTLSPSQAGSVWRLLDTYANRAVNELFIDVRDYTAQEREFIAYQSDVASAFVTEDDANAQEIVASALQSTGAFRAPTDDSDQILALVHRQMPYDIDAFLRLPQVDVHPSEVFEWEMSHATHDVVNYIKVGTPILPPEFQEATYGIQVNLGSVSRFGIRRLTPESAFFFASSQASTVYDTGGSRPEDFSSVLDYYVGLMSTWYAANELMLAGQGSIRFRPDIRVGMRLRLHSTPAMDFYVQGLSHTFSVEAGASRTNLTLVRGINTKSAGLEANLRWTKSGSAIPPELNPYTRLTSIGVSFVTSEGVTVTSDQRGIE